MTRFWKALLLILLIGCILTGTFVLIRTIGRQPAKEVSVTEETIPTAAPPAIETVPEAEAEPEPAKKIYHTVPNFYQTDYPYFRYGSGTVATSGCGLSCLAMVATYLTDHLYTPDVMVHYFGDCGETYVERLEYGCRQMQLPYEKNFNWQQTRQALKKGCVAIVMVNDRTLFTQGQHFIVLTGITESGRILVNDPFGPNYEEEYLKDGFANGFPESAIVSGVCGAWIFDKEIMPPEPYLYEEPIPLKLTNRYAGLVPSNHDFDTFVRSLHALAGDKSTEFQQAVAEVVLNRVMSEEFPNTVWGVLVNDHIFPRVPNPKDGTLTEETYSALYDVICTAMFGPHILPEDVVYFGNWYAGLELWDEIDGCRFYYREQEPTNPAKTP